MADLKTSYASTTIRPFYAGASLATCSADGAYIATAIVDEVNILHNNAVIHTISNDDESEITALQFTPDGAYCSFINQGQLLRIFQLSTGKIVRSIKISSPAYVMANDPTSTLLAIGGTDGAVTVVDISNGYITHSFKGHGGTISAVKFHKDAFVLASGDTNGVVKIWDLVKRKCQNTLQEHNNAVRALDWNSETDEFISGGRDDVVIIFNDKYKVTKTIPVNQQVEACGFTNTGFYTAGGDAILKLFSSEGQLRYATPQPVEELFIIGVLPLDNDKYYVVYSDQTISMVELTDSNVEIISTLAGNHGTIADIRYLNNGKLAMATNSPALRVITESNSLQLYEAHQDLLNALDTTSDGAWVATASKDHEVMVWHNEGDKLVAKYHLKGHAGSITAVGLPNVSTGYPKFVITASTDLTIKKWTLPKPTDSVQVIKTSEYTRRAHEKDINALDIAPNDEFFATASYDKTAKLWNLESGDELAVFKGHKRGLWDVKFCAFDKYIATSSGDKTIRVWSLINYNCVKTFEGHTNAVQRCHFINRGKQLLSCGADGLIKIWEFQTGECVKTIDAHENRIWALAVKEDGEEFVTADADGYINFWKDNSEELHAEEEEKNKMRVEQEQSLQNFIARKDWKNAFLLALTLDHPMRLYNVLNNSISADPNFVFNEEMDEVISTLDNDQILKLFKRVRDWNTNGRFYLVAQRLIRCLLLKHNINKLAEIPSLVSILEAIIPYSERHFNRVDDLLEQSYILDYALIEMDKLM